MEEAQGPTLTCGALLVMMFDSSSCLSSHTKPATGTACEAQVNDWGGVAGEEVDEGCRGGVGVGVVALIAHKPLQKNIPHRA
jgi:hypothetical protein